MNPSYSIFFIVVFNFFELREFLFFPGALNTGFLGGFGEGGASGRHMSTFVIVEAKSLLGTLLSFLRCESLWKFDHVNVHGVGVFGGSRGR